MRRLSVLPVILVLPLTALASVWTTVYRCDEVTPLEAIDPNHPVIYRDIMVGTRLAIVISSDGPGSFYDPNLLGGTTVLWTGSLRILHDDRDQGHGTVTARGYNQKSHNYDGSCLPAAGRLPGIKVSCYDGPYAMNLDFNVDRTWIPGDWFVFDYHAGDVGNCDVQFWDALTSYVAPAATLTFNHVLSRDFNGDTVVDFRDLALLASYWGSTISSDANDLPTQFDLNTDGRIDLADLSLFGEYWLERTDCGKPIADVNSPPRTARHE